MDRNSTSQRIALLTNALAAPFLCDYLRDAGAEVHVALDGAALTQIVQAHAPDVRLIAFLTDVIVPRSLLGRLGPEPYNIHPGPPEFPGVNPEAFAIWEGAEAFGVTVHVIEPRVDSGAIVYTGAVQMQDGIVRRALADQAFPMAIEAFRIVADHCAATDAALPRSGAVWSGPLRTRAQFERLCSTPQGDPDRESLRVRACGEDIQSGSQSSPMTA